MLGLPTEPPHKQKALAAPILTFWYPSVPWPAKHALLCFSVNLATLLSAWIIRWGEERLAGQSWAVSLPALWLDSFFFLQKSSLARAQFSSTPHTELQGICYMGCWRKRTHTYSFGALPGISHPLDRREQGKVTEGVGKLIPAILKVDVLVEREQVHKLPWMSFNSSSSPLPQLLSHSCPVCGPQDSWKWICKGKGGRDGHTLCQRGTLLLLEPAQSKPRLAGLTIRKKVMVCSPAPGWANPCTQASLHWKVLTFGGLRL